MNLGSEEVRMNPSAFEEMIKLANEGFWLRQTQATDGSLMVIAGKNGLVRQFSYRKEYEEL